MTARARLLAVSAWAPGIHSLAEWKEYFGDKRIVRDDDSPDVSEVPSLMRRRMSRLSRMVTSVAFQCCREARVSLPDTRAVLASRHGEISALVQLFEKMNIGETLSPTVFSNSVHHTPLAYASLASANRQLIRAISSGEESFVWAFVEALGLLNDRPASPVLLVAADDIVPRPFDRELNQKRFPYAVGVLLAYADSTTGDLLTLEMKPRTRMTQAGSGIPAIEFFRWYLSGEKKFESALEKGGMEWSR